MDKASREPAEGKLQAANERPDRACFASLNTFVKRNIFCI